MTPEELDKEFDAALAAIDEGCRLGPVVGNRASNENAFVPKPHLARRLAQGDTDLPKGMTRDKDGHLSYAPPYYKDEPIPAGTSTGNPKPTHKPVIQGSSIVWVPALGDRVKIVCDFEDHPKTGPCWVEAMRDCIGKMGTITSIRDNTSVRVKTDDGETWSWPNSSLRLATASDGAQSTTQATFKVGDTVRVRDDCDSVYCKPGEIGVVTHVGRATNVAEVDFGTDKWYAESYWIDRIDPLTEPLRVGDRVEVVHQGIHESTGKRATVTEVRLNRSGYDVVYDDGPNGGWAYRSSLKLLARSKG